MRYGAAIFTALSANGGPPASPVSVGKVLGRGVFVLDGVLYDAQNGHAAQMMDLRPRRICRARTIGRTRRSPMPPPSLS